MELYFNNSFNYVCFNYVTIIISFILFFEYGKGEKNKMSIIERKKTDLAYNEKVVIINIPKVIDKVNENEYMRIEFNKLKEVEKNNIKLAIQLKEINQKYSECKNQNQINVKTMIEYKKIVDKLNFKIECNYLKKEITLYECCDACYYKLCAGYNCIKRIESIRDYFNMSFKK